MHRLSQTLFSAVLLGGMVSASIPKPAKADATVVVGGCTVFAGNPIGELRCLVGAVGRLEQAVASAVANGTRLGSGSLALLGATLNCLKSSASSAQVKEPGAAFTALWTNAGTFLEALATEVWTNAVSKLKEFLAADLAEAPSGTSRPTARAVADRVWERVDALALGNASQKCIVDAIRPAVVELKKRIAPMVTALQNGLKGLYETHVKPQIASRIAGEVKATLRNLAGGQGEAIAKAVIAGYLVNPGQLRKSAKAIENLTTALANPKSELGEPMHAVRAHLDKTFQFSANLVLDVVAEILRVEGDRVIERSAPPAIEKLLKPLGMVTLFVAGEVSKLCGVIPIVGGGICGSVVTGVFSRAWEDIVKPVLAALVQAGIVAAKDAALNFAVAKLKERATGRVDAAANAALTALGPVGTEIRTVVLETVYALADNWVKPTIEALAEYNAKVKALAETAVTRAGGAGGRK